MLLTAIFWLVKNIYRDLKRDSKDAKEQIVGLKLDVREIKTLLGVTEKEVAQLSAKFNEVNEIKEDLIIAKRDIKSVWARLDVIRPDLKQQ